MSRVLVVEDETHLAKGLRFNLEAEGHSVEVARDGETAVQLLSNGSRTPFDAVVRDAMLPGKDGFTVVRELRDMRNCGAVRRPAPRARPGPVLKGVAAGAD